MPHLGLKGLLQGDEAFIPFDSHPEHPRISAERENTDRAERNFERLERNARGCIDDVWDLVLVNVTEERKSQVEGFHPAGIRDAITKTIEVLRDDVRK
jgi:hypothetical protein